MMKLLERLRPVFQAEAQPGASSELVTRSRWFPLSRGILDQIAYPLIDEADDLQVMRLAKFRRDLEHHLTHYKFFSVCEVRDFMSDFGIPLTTDTAKSYKLLHSMHCVSFDIMPRRLYEQLPHLINHCISCGQITHPLIQSGGVIDV